METFKFLVNHYETGTREIVESFEDGVDVATVRNRLFQAYLPELNVRLIYRGTMLKEDQVLNRLAGYSQEGTIITVFITKPNPVQVQPSSSTPLWKWSTSAWIAIVATLWCYKFKLAESFKKLSMLCLYTITLIFLHILFTRYTQATTVSTSTATNENTAPATTATECSTNS